MKEYKNRQGKPAGPAQPPVDLDAPGSRDLPLPLEFTFKEIKIPPKPKDFGYLCLQLQIVGNGKLTGKPGAPAKATVSADSVKLALVRKFENKLDATFGMKFERGFVDALSGAVTGQSPEQFKQTIRKNLELNLQTSRQWGIVTVVPQMTVRPMHPETPLYLGVGVEWVDEVTIVEGYEFLGGVTVKGGFNIGLSKKAWAMILKKVGQSALVKFLQRLGGGVVGWLTAEGIFIGAGAILGSLALVSLVAWAYDRTKHQDPAERAADWYVKGYAGAVFHDSLANPRPAPDAHGERMRVLGEKDAVLDGTEILRRTSDPAANGSPREVTHAFGYLITLQYQAKYNCNETTAQWHFQQELKAKAQRKIDGQQ